MPRGRDGRIEDLAGVPDEGLQYELADGPLPVTPAPHVLHQRVLRELALALHPRVPQGAEPLFAPVD